MKLQEKLFEQTKKRGVIPDVQLDTLNYLFIKKLREEVFELVQALYNTGRIDNSELADCYIVICNIAQANGVDIESAALQKSGEDMKRC